MTKTARLNRREKKALSSQDIRKDATEWLVGSYAIARPRTLGFGMAGGLEACRTKALHDKQKKVPKHAMKMTTYFKAGKVNPIKIQSNHKTTTSFIYIVEREEELRLVHVPN